MAITTHYLSPGAAWVHDPPRWFLVTSQTGEVYPVDIRSAVIAVNALDDLRYTDSDLPRLAGSYDFSLTIKLIEFQMGGAPAIVNCELAIHISDPDDAEEVLSPLVLSLVTRRLDNIENTTQFRARLQPMRENLYLEAPGGPSPSGAQAFKRFLPPWLVHR